MQAGSGEIEMKLSRRSVLAAGIALPIAGRIGSAKAATKIRYLLTSPVPGVAAAVHSSIPKALGYWSESGIDVDIAPFNGSSGAIQVVLAGQAEFTMASPEPLLVAKQQGGNILAVYNHAREAIYTIAVEESSPIKKLEDLKGKTIGLSSLSSGAYPFSKAMLSSVGVDPEKEVKWAPVGLGPQTANALQTKRIDALALWDYAYAVLENLGFKFRHYTTPQMSSLLSFMLIGNGDFVAKNSEATAKMAQGIAKSVIFTRANPEAAVRLHWQAFPTSKPVNLPEDQALKNSVHVLNSRLSKYNVEGRKTPKWGFFDKRDWENTQDFYSQIGLIHKKIDVGQYYTDRFVDQINDFDPKEVIAKAKSFK
jgi:NitT/TauT family transport system substrate-binding protein